MDFKILRGTSPTTFADYLAALGFIVINTIAVLLTAWVALLVAGLVLRAVPS